MVRGESSSGHEAAPGWVRRSIFLWWGVGVGLWFVWFLARELRGILLQLVIALFLSFALEPTTDRLHRRGLSRGLATGLSLLALLTAILVFLGIMGSLLATQLNDLVEALPDYLRSGQDWLQTQFGVRVQADDLIAQFQPGGQASQVATDMAGNLVEVGTTVATVLFDVLTVALFTFYLTADGPRLRRTICSVLPPSRQRTVLEVWELAINKTGAYITSRTVLALASVLFHWTVFRLLDLPSSLALALWVGVVSQFIPTLGTYLAGILPIVVTIGVDPAKALWVVAAIVIYQQIENYVLQPRVTAQTLDMHPAIAIATVLAGTSLFGAAGAVLALPVTATLTGFLSAYVERHDVVESRLTGAPDRRSDVSDRRAEDENDQALADGDSQENFTDPQAGRESVQDSEGSDVGDD